jgi:hypothetical protein
MLNANAFVILNKNYRLAKPDNTIFRISSEGCTGAGISDSVLKSAMEKAVDVWNDVPESRLYMKTGSKSSTSIASSSVPKGEVIVGCEALGAGVGGVTSVSNSTGSARIKMNSDVYSGTNLYGFTGVLIHELGHAVGLTHSKDPASVMTYEANDWVDPKYLSQDDVDGVVYLYPNEKQMGGLLGSCSSYASSRSGSARDDFGLVMVFGFLFVFALSMIFRFKKKG